jgi:hypothetical protein
MNVGGQAVTIRAIKQAERLRSRGLSYQAISIVMGDYHGQYFSERSWRKWLRDQGVPAKPHGVPFGADHPGNWS